MGEVLCKAVHYLQNVSMLCSVFTLTVISIERYIAIRHPLKAKYICTLVHARLVIMGVWILSFIGSLPVLFGQRHIEVGMRRKGYYCLREWQKPFFEKIYELYMLTVMLIIPSFVMTIAYLGICFEMWNVSYRRADMRSGR
uniref:G-protein coupled receptors family 1 profile domain-containing protein n=3 Tax=Octopus bimaculoides TaxID=37653 RepID=A0A0L8HBP6_OCTBM